MTAIEWTDKTENVVRGCSRTCASGTKQSGCGDATGGGCYAEEQAGRIVRMDRAKGIPEGQGKYDRLVRITPTGPRWTGVIEMAEDDLRKLVRGFPRKPIRRFINSMSDPFHKNFPRHQLDRFWAALLINCRHERGGMTTFQILTKRAAEAREYLSDTATLDRVARAAGALMEDGDGWYDAIAFNPLGLTDPRIWLGTSIENRPALIERAPDLAATPASVRFWSVEPLLADLGDVAPYLTGCDWLIAGCESGDGARLADVAWYRALREACAAAGVPFFLKQATDRPPVKGVCTSEGPITSGPGSHRKPGGGNVIGAPYLDGVQHLAFPPTTSPATEAAGSGRE